MIARHALWLLALLGLSEPASAQGKLAIIIDDVGYNAVLGERTLALAGDFTLALLPEAPHSARLARLAAAQGKEIMLHNPMSNTRGLPLDGGALTGDMDRATFLAVLERNFELIPQAVGLNNHMGSLLTQKAEPMGWLMESLQSRNLYFVDSRTSVASRAWETARLYQVPSLRRDVFLDHDRDPEQIARQLSLAIELAQTRGYAVAIGHPYPETLRVLEGLQPLLDAADVALVPVSRLLEDPDASLAPDSSRHCLAPPPSLWLQPPMPPAPVDPRTYLNVIP